MGQEEKTRFIWLDELRGIALLSMIVYHFIFQSTVVGIAEERILSFPISFVFQLLAQILFISIAGICCYFSEKNKRRGLEILGCAAIVTVVTCLVMPENRIMFGILHFLGLSILFYGFFGKWMAYVPTLPGIFLNGILFFILHFTELGDKIYDSFMTSAVWVRLIESKSLTIFGLPHRGFISSDYFPIFPWIFLFLFGVFLGKYIKEHQEKFWIERKPISWLFFFGQHTLVIYMIHIPLIWGILYAMKYFFS